MFKFDVSFKLLADVKKIKINKRSKEEINFWLKKIKDERATLSDQIFESELT